jgi:hypothetical protein
MFNTIVGAGAVEAGAASRYGSGSDEKMRLLAAPAPQHWFLLQGFEGNMRHSFYRDNQDFLKGVGVLSLCLRHEPMRLAIPCFLVRMSYDNIIMLSLLRDKVIMIPLSCYHRSQ